MGNDTIYGGTGNSSYTLSNGTNWLDAGGGNDFIQAGIGSNTIYGGAGAPDGNLIYNPVLFGRERCDAANDFEWRMKA